jgi:hypothetical protein
MRRLTATPALCAAACVANAQADRPPYPPSPVIAGIAFDRDTLVTAAQGSDQFGTTWAADDNLYVAWGDGGGFEGTNSLGRASLGVGRIAGLPPDWHGTNVWGGVSPLSSQPSIPGKTSSGVIALGGAIYLYVVEQDVWTRNRLWRSTDLGMSWTDLGPLFDEPGAAFCDPGILQFGRDYAGARDGFVYGYSEEPWPDALALFRVPQDRLASRDAYEFFAGLDAAGRPTWTSDLAQQKPVFTDPNGTRHVRLSPRPEALSAGRPAQWGLRRVGPLRRAGTVEPVDHRRLWPGLPRVDLHPRPRRRQREPSRLATHLPCQVVQSRRDHPLAPLRPRRSPQPHPRNAPAAVVAAGRMGSGGPPGRLFDVDSAPWLRARCRVRPTILLARPRLTVGVTAHRMSSSVSPRSRRRCW